MKVKILLLMALLMAALSIAISHPRAAQGPVPQALTTSDWVDYLSTLSSRDDKIAALATYHRRIEYDATQRALQEFAVPSDPSVNDQVRSAATDAIKKLPAAADYVSGAAPLRPSK